MSKSSCKAQKRGTFGILRRPSEFRFVNASSYPLEKKTYDAARSLQVDDLLVGQELKTVGGHGDVGGNESFDDASYENL
jgi:hypothetical protein